MTLGKSGCPSDTGATSMDFRTIRHAGPPFHYPTNLALAADGSLYISDGYGNARVHQFSPDGIHLSSWGEPGGGPGEFRVPHGIAVGPDGTVVVADRENSRLQFFSPDGQFLEGMDRHRAALPGRGRRRRARVRRGAGLPSGDVAGDDRADPGRDRRPGEHLRPDGRLLARWGGGSNPCAPGDFFAPHDLCLDSRGDLYVGEVTWSAGGNRGAVPADCHSLQKFARLG